MNKKLVLAGTGAAVVAAAGFGSVALAGEDASPPATAQQQDADAPTGELDEVPEAAPAEGEARFESEGGTVLARCTDDGAELVWWVAADGYRVDDVEPRTDGDDHDAEVEFKTDTRDVDIDVTCAGGAPQADIDVEDDSDDDDQDDDDGDHDDDRDDDHGDDDHDDD